MTAPKEPRPDPLLSTRQVAEILGLSIETVRRQHRAGNLPGFRVAKNMLRFRRADVDAWLDRRRE